MNGIEQAYFQLAQKILVEANKELRGMQCSEATRLSSGHKEDTLGLDSLVEGMIVGRSQAFDSSLVVITEELGQIPPDLLLDKDKMIFFCDPTDRSKPLAEFIDAAKKPDKTVGSILKPIGWEAKYGNCTVSGAYGSITAVRNGAILFNVMVNYVTQQMFTASDEGIVYFSIAKGKIPEKTGNVAFRENNSRKFVTYLETEKYRRNLEQTALALSEIACIAKNPGGPARILYLSDLYEDNVGLILTNGEKVGEWLGWLAYVKYAKYPDNKRALQAFRISFEDSQSREGVLLAPAPHYSPLVTEQGDINLDKLMYFTNPSHYRETLAICPMGNIQVMHSLDTRDTCTKLKI